MIRADQIPDEVVEAMRNALKNPPNTEDWTWDDHWRLIFAAAINAWPGGHIWDTGQVWHHPAVVLPLPQKGGE